MIFDIAYAIIYRFSQRHREQPIYSYLSSCVVLSAVVGYNIITLIGFGKLLLIEDVLLTVDITWLLIPFVILIISILRYRKYTTLEKVETEILAKSSKKGILGAKIYMLLSFLIYIIFFIFFMY